MTSSETQQTVASVANDTTPAASQVIPNNQLVVLRERELDCDLATAIQRVREDHATSTARILIVGEKEPVPTVAPVGKAIPIPGRGGVRKPTVGLSRPRLPMTLGQVARSSGEAALMACGSRLATPMASLNRFFEEIESSLSEVGEAVLEGTRPQLQGQLRVLGEMITWMRVTADDLGGEIRSIAAGLQPVDVEDLCRELPTQIESFFPDLRVNLAPVGERCECQGRPTQLAEALFLACVISAHRISGRGSLNLQLSVDSEQVRLRILGLGEPAEVDLAKETARLRAIITQDHGGRIVPDGMGPFGTGLVLELPVHRD